MTLYEGFKTDKGVIYVCGVLCFLFTVTCCIPMRLGKYWFMVASGVCQLARHFCFFVDQNMQLKRLSGHINEVLRQSGFIQTKKTAEAWEAVKPENRSLCSLPFATQRGKKRCSKWRRRKTKYHASKFVGATSKLGNNLQTPHSTPETPTGRQTEELFVW